MEFEEKMHWQTPLAAWSKWEDGDAAAPLNFIEPMLRRRLSPLAKTSLWVANQCAKDMNKVRMVYASQHGEIARTTAMLEELIANQPVSPTGFGMSVLNASIGLYSIIRNNTAPATAISAGEETFGFGLLEAHAQLISSPDQPVLLIYADEPVPDVWQAEGATRSHAIALLLKQGAPMILDCHRSASDDAAVSEDTQAQTFSRSLDSAAPAAWNGTRHRWQWQQILITTGPQ